MKSKTVGGAKIASREDRFKAALFDIAYSVGPLIVVSLFFAIFSVVGLFFGLTPNITNAKDVGTLLPLIYGLVAVVTSLAGLAASIWMLIFPFIQLYQISKTGQTLGKKRLGIRIIHVESGKKVTVARYLCRSALAFFVPALLSSVIPFLWLIDNGWILFDKDHDAIHDKAVQTRVVKV